MFHIYIYIKISNGPLYIYYCFIVRTRFIESLWWRIAALCRQFQIKIQSHLIFSHYLFYPARSVPQIYQSYHRIWICITSNYSFVMFCARFWTLPIAHDICATLRQYQTMTGIFSIWHPWHPWHSFMTCPRCQAAHSAQPEGSTSSVGSMDVIHHHPKKIEILEISSSPKRNCFLHLSWCYDNTMLGNCKDRREEVSVGTSRNGDTSWSFFDVIICAMPPNMTAHCCTTVW
jgi:hypothetical protein